MSENDDSIRAFDADLSRLAKVIDVPIALVVQKITLDLHTRISKRTPVDTGRARSSWDVKTGQPSDFVPPESGATGIRDVSAEIANIDGRKIVFITSNLDYMQYLEQGSSKQAPVGMVEISIAELEAEIESIIDLNP